MLLNAKQQWLMDVARKAGDQHYDAATRRCLIGRDTVWYAISLLFAENGPKALLGQELLASLQSEDATHTPATIIAVLRALPTKLSAASTENLLRNLERELVPAAEANWQDGNVNHPLAAYCTLICGGEMLRQPWATALGSRKLQTFQRTIGDRRHRFRRQAEMSEYHSLTYTALNLWWLALIAEYAQHEDARRLAFFLEQALWIDIAMHFHAPSQQFAGPHSRSYQDDSSGGFSAMHCTFWVASDAPLFLWPAMAERYRHISNLVQNALVAIVPFHFPDQAREIAWHKRYPYYVQKTTYGEHYHENSRRWQPAQSGLENRQQVLRSLMRGVVLPSADTAADPPPPTRFAFDDELYPGGWSDLTFYQTAEYALGTAALPYVNAGHADSFVLRWRRAERIAAMADFRSAYTRGVYNDAVVGQQNFCHIAGGTIDASYLYEEGRCAVYQHRNRAIVCYSPKRSGHLQVSSFRLDLIFSMFAPFAELWCGALPVRQFPLQTNAGDRICLQDFRTFAVIIPLPPQPAASTQPVKMWVANDHLMISFYNYRGPRRSFSRDEINGWRTGFYIELAGADEFADFASFKAYAHALTLTESVEASGSRQITYSNGSDHMQLVYNPLRERILSRQWNGVEEGVEHLDVEAGGSTEGVLCPKTIFGSEAMGNE